MFESYKVGVKLTVINEFSKGLTLAAAQFSFLNKQADIFHSKISKIKALTLSGAGMVGGGFALAAPFVYAISKAAELQKQMLGIQVATGGTTAQMDKMRLVLEKASAPTQFSAITVAEMAKKVATSNSFTADQITNLMPAIAKFADVQVLLKGTDPLSSVTDAVKMMHLAQKYSPGAVEPYFNSVTKASLMMPGGVSELRSALSYFQPMGKAALGVDDTHSLMLVALLSRLGLSGSRGGTNLLAAMSRTIPGIFGSGLLTGKSGEALADMGFVDKAGHSKFMTNGKFDPDKWVMGLSEFARSAIAADPIHGRERVMKDYQHAFGTQGGKVAGLLSSPGAIDQLASMGQDYARLASMGAIQDMFVKQSVSQQFQTALTNFQNAMIELGINLLPATTKFLNIINSELNELIPWMQKHKELVKDVSLGLISFAGLMAAGGVIALTGAAFAALLTPVGELVVAFTTLASFFSYFRHNQTSAPHRSSAFGMFGSNFGIPNLFGHSSSQATVVHTTVNLDGRAIGQAVTKHQVAAASRPPTQGSGVDGSMGLLPVAYNGAHY